MSIEATLQSITDSLQRIAAALEAQNAQTGGEPCVELPGDTSDLPPLTVKELMGFNQWIIQVKEFLGPNGDQLVAGVLASHGLNNTPEIGDDRALMQAVAADIQKLVDNAQQGAAS